jgi:hypothetical protein
MLINQFLLNFLSNMIVLYYLVIVVFRSNLLVRVGIILGLHARGPGFTISYLPTRLLFMVATYVPTDVSYYLFSYRPMN